MIRVSLLFAIIAANQVFASVRTADKFVFPDWKSYSYNTYSGFLQIGTTGRFIHYVFVESATKPKTDPVVLWLNGGPGCSSMLGLLQELGPSVMDAGSTTWTQNSYSWNQNANLLFFESPVGVGFSYYTGDKPVYDDKSTASDNYEALKLWFSDNYFSDYKGRNFYITGESYAGMYVPFTAKAIIDGNSKLQPVDQIALKGIAIGNGVLVMDETFRATQELNYFKDRNFFDPYTLSVLNNQCQYNPESISCQQAKATVDKIMARVNPYNVYSYCYGSASINSEIPYVYTSWILQNKIRSVPVIPCTDTSNIEKYLTTPAVLSAMHITQQNTWEACNMEINTNYQRDPIGSYVLLPDIFQAKVKILIYSGDQDSAVSLTETIESIKLIPGIAITQDWTVWGDGDINNQQLAGWTMKYNYLDLIIVRGAGHMVPQDQRQRAFKMFNDFLASAKTSQQTDENLIIE